MTSRARRRASSLFRGRRRRGGERGASVFIVVLVIAMLTAIGVFAARSSRLSTTASGHARQMTQTRYFTEYGMELAASALATSPDVYLLHMRNSPDQGCYAMGGSVGASCMKLHAKALQAQLFPQGALVEAPTPEEAGSLGPASIDAAFSIEITSYTKGASAPGFDLSEGGSASFYFATVTMTGTSRIRPAGSPVWTSSASSRAFLTVGPLSL